MKNTMSNSRKLFWILFLSVTAIFVQTINGQKFNASAERTTIGQNERLQVEFTFEGGDINAISNFRAPTFNGFRILTGPNQSSSMQIINGKVSGSLTLSYVLQASAMGEFTISSASIDFGGRTFSTQPLKIKVEKASPQQQKNNDSGYSDAELSKSVFILAETNKTRAYQGEQITVTYKLYTKLNISSPQITKLPSYEGFWAEEIGPIQNINFEVEMYKGERFRVAKIKQVALFATKTGPLNVTPFELNIPVIVKKRKTGNDVFDEFFNDSFFARTETVQFPAKSNIIKVQIDPLPESAPASFSGAVGNFNFKAEIDKKNLAQNESFTLRLNVNGTGNIKLLKMPEPQLNTGLEKYEPKSIDNINKGSQISGQKIVDYLIVPRVSGDQKIPPIEFSFFNPSTKKYNTIISPEFVISVKQGIGGDATSQSFSKEDVKLLSEDIRYIKTSDYNLEPIEEISLIKSWFWPSLIIPSLIFAGFFVFMRRQAKLNSNVSLLKYQKAEKAARKRLKNAKAALDSGQIQNFYTEISLALFGYLEDKLSIQKSEFTIELAEQKLLNKNVNEALINRVKVIAEKCEYARFAPQSELSAGAGNLYEETVDVIIEVDSALEKRK